MNRRSDLDGSGNEAAGETATRTILKFKVNLYVGEEYKFKLQKTREPIFNLQRRKLPANQLTNYYFLMLPEKATRNSTRRTHSPI